MYEVILLDERGTAELRVPLGALPLYVGRAPHNHLVVSHASVSGRHASLFVHEGTVYVEDLGSSNGTRVAGEPVSGRVAVPPGADVRLGEARTLRIQERGASREAPRRWLIRPLDGGVARAIDRDRFRLGPDPDADLRTPSGPTRTLLLSPSTGELALAVDDEEVPLAAGDPVEAGGMTFEVVQAEAAVAATIQVQRHAYPYDVRVHTDPSAASVVVSAPDVDPCAVTAPNRVALLTVLAQQLSDDLERAELPETERGWVSDEDVAIGIWGRAGRARPIKVELCRTRAQLRKGGLDGWCLEKRGTSTRLRAATVVIET